LAEYSQVTPDVPSLIGQGSRPVVTSKVVGEDPEAGVPRQRCDSPEVPAVEGEDGVGFVLLGEDDIHGVGKIELQRTVGVLDSSSVAKGQWTDAGHFEMSRPVLGEYPVVGPIRRRLGRLPGSRCARSHESLEERPRPVWTSRVPGGSARIRGGCGRQRSPTRVCHR
jgi:hypothetical protein